MRSPHGKAAWRPRRQVTRRDLCRGENICGLAGDRYASALDHIATIYERKCRYRALLRRQFGVATIAQRCHEIEHFDHLQRSQVEGRLAQHDRTRSGNQTTRDGEHLPLPSREIDAGPMDAVGQERILGEYCLPSLGTLLLRQLTSRIGAEFEVLPDDHAGENLPALRNVRDSQIERRSPPHRVDASAVEPRLTAEISQRWQISQSRPTLRQSILFGTTCW